MSSRQTSSRASKSDRESELEDARKEVLKQREKIIALEASCRLLSFPQFNDFPNEIKNMIWRCTYLPRILSMEWRRTPGDNLYLVYKPSRFSTSQRFPASAVCKASREIFKLDYERLDNELTGATYINFDTDTLFLPIYYHNIGVTIDIKILEPLLLLDNESNPPTRGTRGLRSLAIRREMFTSLRCRRGEGHIPAKPRDEISWLLLLMKALPQLKELVIVGNAQILSTGEYELSPYTSTDIKFAECRDDGSLDLASVLATNWPNIVRKHHLTLASLKLYFVGARRSTEPDDCEPLGNYITTISESSQRAQTRVILEARRTQRNRRERERKKEDQQSLVNLDGGM